MKDFDHNSRIEQADPSIVAGVSTSKRTSRAETGTDRPLLEEKGDAI